MGDSLPAMNRKSYKIFSHWYLAMTNQNCY